MEIHNLIKIVIEPHILLRAAKRGASESEIFDVLENGIDISVKGDRSGKAKVYDFNKIWKNKNYLQKRIEVIYTIESGLIVL